MASPTTPTHGRHGAIYRYRLNGFSGVGLNDLTHGTAYSGAGTSAYFEIEIDGEGTPDTFRWRKNGGGWTSTVAITGGAQTLSDSFVISFAATTGHTSGDKWTSGHLSAEACTEAGTTAQITDATKRILDPNNPPTFTDTGGETVLRIDYTTGTAYFTGNVTTVTVTGNNGYVHTANLQKVGYALDWSFTAALDMADQSYMGQAWKHHLPGQGSGTGSANQFLIASNAFLDGVENKEMFYMQLYNYDPDQDQTGDHYNCWVWFSGVNTAAPVGEVVTEGLEFTIDGIPSFTANT